VASTCRTASNHRELLAWQRAVDLAVACSRASSRFPAHERYALASQLRRAAVSVAANIAEGNGRFHRGEYLHHLSIANGSLREVDTLLTIAGRLSYIPDDALAELHGRCEHAGRLLVALLQALRNRTQ